MNFLNRLPEIFTPCPPTCPPFSSQLFPQRSFGAGEKNLRITVAFSEFCFSVNPSQHHFQSMKSPRASRPYQFQPCLLDGEYLSIRAVSLSSASFCSRRNWEADWFSTPGLVGMEGRLCSLDQCRCWLTLLNTQHTGRTSKWWGKPTGTRAAVHSLGKSLHLDLIRENVIRLKRPITACIYMFYLNKTNPYALKRLKCWLIADCNAPHTPASKMAE